MRTYTISVTYRDRTVRYSNKKMLLLFLHGQGASTPQPTLCLSACGQSLPPAWSQYAYLTERKIERRKERKTGRQIER